MKIKYLSALALVISTFILSSECNPVIRRRGLRPRRQEYGSEVGRPEVREFPAEEELQKQEVPALYSVPRTGDAPEQPDENSNLGNERQPTTTELNFESQTPRPNGLSEEFVGTPSTGIQENTPQTTSTPFETNHEDFQVQPFKGYGINSNGQRSSTEDNIEEYRKRFNSIVQAHIPPTANEIPHTYSQRPIDQQQVENSFLLRQEQTPYQENQQGQQRPVEQYFEQPQRKENQQEQRQNFNSEGYGFHPEHNFQRFGENQRFSGFNQNDQNVDTNVIESAGENDDSALEGLGSHILDAKLLERVQQIIEDYERQQNDFLQKVRQNKMPNRNYGIQNNNNQNQESYRPNPISGQSHFSQENSVNFFRDRKSFPGSPNLEFQPALLGGQFIERRQNPSTPMFQQEDFRQFHEHNSPRVYNTIEQPQQLTHPHENRPQEYQYQNQERQQEYASFSPQPTAVPVQFFSQATQRPNSEEIGHPQHLPFSAEAHSRFPFRPKPEEGFRPSFNIQGYEPTSHHPSAEREKSEEFRGFQPNQVSTQYLPPVNNRYEAPQSHNYNNGGDHRAKNPNVITHTIYIHEKPTTEAIPEGLGNRAIITGADIAHAQQYNNEKGQDQSHFQFISASAQLKVGGEREGNNNGHFQQPQIQVAPQNEEIEKPKPIYGVPIAPVLGPESLDDAVVVEAVKNYNSPSANSFEQQNFNTNNIGSQVYNSNIPVSNSDLFHRYNTENNYERNQVAPPSGLYRLPNNDAHLTQPTFNNGENGGFIPSTSYRVNTIQRRNIH